MDVTISEPEGPNRLIDREHRDTEIDMRPASPRDFGRMGSHIRLGETHTLGCDENWEIQGASELRDTPYFNNGVVSALI